MPNRTPKLTPVSGTWQSTPEVHTLGRRSMLKGAVALGTLSAAGGTLLAPDTALAAAKVGQAAPPFDQLDTHGAKRDLKAMQGRIVVLEWTNHGCPFVRKHYESSNMQALQREITAAGAIWLSVISSAPGKQGHVSAPEANALTKERKAAPTGILLDPAGALGHAYGAQTTPHMYIIDAQGVLRYMGGIDSIPSANPADIPKAQPFFKEAFTALSKGKAVPKPITRPYGCSVKYST